MGAEGGGVGYGGGLALEIWMVDFCLLELPELDPELDAELLAWLTVESWSCISIMWSPSLMVRLSGAAPDRKSFTWNKKQPLL